GAHLAGMTDAQRTGGAHQPAHELVIDGLDDDQTRARRALLAGVAERRVDDGRHGLVEVGVGIDDDGVLAAHLGDHSLHVALTAAAATIPVGMARGKFHGAITVAMPRPRYDRRLVSPGGDSTAPPAPRRRAWRP